MQNNIDHISIGVTNLTDAGRFFDTVLETIGVKRLAANDAFIAYGKDAPQFLAMLPYNGAASAPATAYTSPFTRNPETMSTLSIRRRWRSAANAKAHQERGPDFPGTRKPIWRLCAIPSATSSKPSPADLRPKR